MSDLGMLGEFFRGLRTSSLRMVVEEAEKDEPYSWEQDGLSLRRELFYSHWRGTDTRWRILVDGYEFAAEIQRIGGGLISGGISTCYWVWLDLPLKLATKCLKGSGLKKHKEYLMEEFYPTENGPPRWNACAKEFDDVVKMWKTWNQSYRVNAHTNENQEPETTGSECELSLPAAALL